SFQIENRLRGAMQPGNLVLSVIGIPTSELHPGAGRNQRPEERSVHLGEPLAERPLSVKPVVPLQTGARQVSLRKRLAIELSRPYLPPDSLLLVVPVAPVNVSVENHERLDRTLAD